MSRPFSSGTQYLDWQNMNCCRCELLERGCEIAAALTEAAMSDGSVSKEIAQRMGYVDPLAFLWDCPERVTVRGAR